jgi:hypothetical protein
MPISNPNSISDCVVWLDSNDLSTLYSDTLGTTPILGNSGEFIKCWKDKTTGKLFTNSNTGVHGPRYEPTFYTLPTIRFINTNAQDTGFTANFTQAYKSCMVFMVAYTDIHSNAYLYSHAHASSTAITNPDLWIPLSQNSTFIRNYYISNYQQFLTLPLSSFCVLNSYIDNDADNGFGVGIGLNGSYSLLSNPINVLLQDSKPMVIHSVGKNCLGTSSGNNFLGYIGEVLVYSRMLIPDEIQQVENYLSQKWFGVNSPTTAAKSSGSWYDPTIWLGDELPQPNQRVYCGDKEVIINGDINVDRISNENLIPKMYGTNGKFILNDNFNIKADIQNSVEHFTKNCLEVSTPSGSVDLSGNILSITNLTNQQTSYRRYGACVEHNGNCDLNVYGNVGSGRLDHYGIYHDSLGKLTIYGNIYSPQGTSSVVYIAPKNDLGKVTLYGNAIGGGGINSPNHAINNTSSNTSIDIFGNLGSVSDGNGLRITGGGLHTIYGDVSASSGGREGHGILIGSGARPTVHVYGNVYADNNDSGTINIMGAAAVFNNSYFSNLYIYGNIFNKGFRRSTSQLSVRTDVSQAIVARRVNIATPTNRTVYRKTTATPLLSFFSVGNYDLSLLPPLSDTIIGLPYGQGDFDFGGVTIPSLYGQMKIPAREVVRVQEIVGTKKGIAIFEPDDLQYVWDCDFEDIAINNNTIGDRLSALMSTEQMGRIISENNL